MSTITKVALAGASGSLGKPVLEHLLESNFTVTVLTREDSTSTFPTGVKVVKVDYTSEENLTTALQGQDALISTLATEVISSQDILMKAAIAASLPHHSLRIRVRHVSGGEQEAASVLPEDLHPEAARGGHQRHEWRGDLHLCAEQHLP